MDEFKKFIDLNNINCFFDIGANVGIFTKYVKTKYPSSMCHVFEPVNIIFEQLKKNLKDNTNIYFNNCLVDNKTIENNYIYLDPHLRENNIIGTCTKYELDPNRPINSISNWNKQIINSISLSDYINNNNISNIDLIKIDVEGYEYGVIEGLIPFIKSTNIKPILYVEVGWGTNHPEWLTKCLPVYNSLFELGYEVVDFTNKTKDIFFYPKKNVSYMNYVYLIVEGCNGYGKDFNGIEKLDFSIKSLKKNTSKYKNIYVYYSYDDTNIDTQDKIINYCKNNNIISIDNGKLKHDFGKSCKNISNPYRLNILIEKIYILLNHDDNEDICFVDLDTEFNYTIDKYIYNLNKPILWTNEYNLLQKKKLVNFFNNIMKYNVDIESRMFNTGFIFIPKLYRKSLAKEALQLALEMNKYPDNLRPCKDLDEQIALSIVIFKYYKNNIILMNKHINHYWDKCMRNEKYWE
jgi:FkbM family methyltransferase